VIRFHLDEHVDHAIAHALRRRGVDVTTSGEARLLGATDEEQLEFAGVSGRVIVTHDADFLRMHQQGVPHSGIVYAAPGSQDVGAIVRFLCLLHDCLDAQQMTGAVEFL
jgi:hypothetical protein